MRFVHLADLHLGRRVCGFSLIEDQKYILDRILDMIGEEKPDIVLIAGDVYDKLSPPAEAVTLLDSFLTELSRRGIETFIISGNHDSPERIAFGADLMNKSGIHFSPVYDGKAAHFTVTDEYGEADIYLLPYLRAAEARRFFPDEDIPDTAAAVSAAIRAMNMDKSRRNIIISHQFVQGGETSDSERGAVGGTDGVPADVYKDFDYAALGHLHKPQAMSGNVRYGGTPLKYSVSEAEHKKSLAVCELGEKGTPVKTVLRELVPLRDMRMIKGSFEDIMSESSDDFVQVMLTDTERIPDAQKRLRAQYPRIMAVKYINEQEREPIGITEESAVRTVSPFELFESFFLEANGKKMTAEQSEHMRGLIDSIWG
ncbi:MAG: exonuclease SbcCD subunit D [Oscillospiraceae bacterium]|nr:exonuclease SbcCD subunit D [Oscillospiraceae bacterium]